MLRTTALAGSLCLALAAQPQSAAATTIIPGDITINTADRLTTLGDIQVGGVLRINTAGPSHYTGAFSGGGALVLAGGTLTIAGANSYSGGTTIAGGTLLLNGAGTLGSSSNAVTVGPGATLDLGGTTQVQSAVYLSGGTIQNGTLVGPITTTGGTIIGISDTSALTATAGLTTLSGTNDFGGGIVLNGGIVAASSDRNFDPGSASITFNGGVLRITGTSFDSTSRALVWGPNGGGFDIVEQTAFVVSQQLSGPGGLTVSGRGSLNLAGNNSYSGGTTINGGAVILFGGATLGSAAGTTTINAGGILLVGGALTQAAIYLNGGELSNGSIDAPITSTGGIIDWVRGTASVTTTAGVTRILGPNTYSGATVVNGGVLDVEGTLTGTSSVKVNAGGTLTGNGIIASPLVSIARGGTFAAGTSLDVKGALTGAWSITINAGGTLTGGGIINSPLVSNASAGTSAADTAPANATTIVGNLTMAPGAIYTVQLGSAASSFANVNGSATLGGASVNALYAGGDTIARRNKILTATGGISGTFDPAVTTNLPNIKAGLSYDTQDVYLDLSLAFAAPPGARLSGNQQEVGNAIAGYFNTGNSIPVIYGSLTPSGLTQLSGESTVGAQQTSFNAMNQFMNVISDPFMAGRDAPTTGGGDLNADTDEAMSYAAGRARPVPEREAYAMVTKARPAQDATPHWNVWAAGFGGSQTIDGNARTGSSDTTSSIYGVAIGADYRVSPSTIAGFALAGGGTHFSVTGMGYGRSDLFQAAVYARQGIGPAYLGATLAYGWQDITTDRTLTIAGVDRLHAEFDANTFSGRLEGGYRLVTPWSGGVGLTPYAAVQVTDFVLPAYAESVSAGTGAFALSYDGKSVVESRSELGLRADRSFTTVTGILTLRGRVAWAHDYNRDRAIAATFQSLPGASFVVNGPTQAADAALATVSAETRWTNGWSATATFEGEFSDVTRAYSGKGVLRYAW